MKRTLSLLALSALFATSLFASRRIIPVAGHTAGANNTFWTTDLHLSNRSTDSRVFHLTFHPDASSAFSRDIALGGGESVLLRDAAAPEAFGRPAGTNWLGELEIEAEAEFEVGSRTFTGSDDGSFGSVQNGMDPSILPNHGTVTGLVVDDKFRSNVALTNAGDDTVHVHLDLRRRDGSVAGSDDVTVGPHQTLQRSAAGYIRRSDDSPLSLSWTSDGPAFVLGSVIDNRSGDPTDSPSVASSSKEMFFPVAGKTAGAGGTFWTTSVSVTNTEDRPGDLTIEFRGNDGTRVSRSVPLPSRGTYQSDDIFQVLGLSSGSGSLTITSTVGATAAARIFNSRQDGSTLGSELQPQTRASRSSLVRLDGVRRDDRFRLNVAIAGDDVRDADGTIRLRDDRGQEVEVQRFHVPAGSSLQFPVNATSVPVQAGEVEVETEHGVEISAVASTIDNKSGDTVMHEAEQENERQQELDFRISPATAAVGSPVTFTAVTTGSQPMTSIAWDFGDGITGSGASVVHTFSAAGEFKVTMIVTFASGAIARRAEDVTITGSGTAPGGATGLDFSWTPASPQPGQPVQFTATVAGNAPAGAVIKWTIEGIRSTGAIATHTFATAGTFEVEAELEQEGGTTLRAVHNVVVGGGSPGGGQGVTSIDFAWTPAAPRVNQPVTFTATVTGTPGAGAEIKWRFPDGSRPRGSSVTFTFTSSGAQSVEVEIDEAGKTPVQRQKTVTVAP